MGQADYFVRMNQQPLTTLPPSEGVEAGRQFVLFRDKMLNDRHVRHVISGRGDPAEPMINGYMKIAGPSVDLYLKSYSDFSERPSRIDAEFLLWSPIYRGKRENPGVPHMGVVGITFSRGRVLEYYGAQSCANEAAGHKVENLHSQILGTLLLDWNGDDIIDHAVLLEGGGFIFYQGGMCEEDPKTLVAGISSETSGRRHADRGSVSDSSRLFPLQDRERPERLAEDLAVRRQHLPF